MRLRLDLNEQLAFLLQSHRYKAAYGGRGSGKSYGFADALLFLSLSRPMRILCAREFQVSIADSVHYLLKTRIEALAELNPDLDVRGSFDVQQRSIRTTNGSEFIFSGLAKNIENIRSKEALDVVWIEEAQSVSEYSWEVLVPTMRKKGSEIWASFNPDQDTDPTYKRLVKNPPPGTVSVELNWNDNPWITAELLAEKDYLYSVDPDAAAHVWGGECRLRSNAQVLHDKWVVDAWEPGADWHGPYYGVDWGTVHPTVMVRSWITGDVGSLERELWLSHEAYKVHADIDQYAALFDQVPGSRTHVSRADCSRPETIGHMNRHGFPLMEAAPKWSGSVNDGVAHLRGYKKIHIHQRCKHAAEQARLWKWKVDRLTGDVLPVLVDLNDDIWDAVRYALAPVIQHNFLEYGYQPVKSREQKRPFDQPRSARERSKGFHGRRGGIL